VIASIHRCSKIGDLAILLGMVVVLLAACGGSTQSSGTGSTSTSFNTTTRTSDGMFHVQFSVTPDQPGTNTFTVNVANVSSGKSATNVNVRLTTIMLTMDMGSNTLTLQSNGQGKYSAQGELAMNGRWEIHILLRTPDNALHEAIVKFSTSS
jgi:hypothetical protein